jgi:PD-(D/E)XK nuclease superfamily
MARPKEGYRNAAGQPVPGTTDITGRYMDRSRLLYWAFNRGREGHKKLYDGIDLNIGTVVHQMAELDLKGQGADDIAFYAKTTLTDPAQLERAQTAFVAFKKWRAKFHIETYKQEISLVSEKYQFGGTLDTVALIRNGLGLVDFKSSTKGEVYEDHLIQLAGYGLLWEENFPAEPLTEGSHLIVLPKEGGEPVHRHYTREALKPFRKKFKLYRKAYALEQMTGDPKVLAGAAVEASVVPQPVATPREKITPRIEHSPRPMSMAEIMRAYGHVKDDRVSA